MSIDGIVIFELLWKPKKRGTITIIMHFLVNNKEKLICHNNNNYNANINSIILLLFRFCKQNLNINITFKY